jgi:thiol-disulfide isomerase/thioredoxin
MFRRFSWALLALPVLALACPSLSPVARAADRLTIGSAAPSLDIEHWIHDGGGKFKPVTKFEEGKVYVVEFWATWCGPCVASMPHIVELQKQYADKGVQIISISDEDLETVEAFLDRPVPAARTSRAPRAATAPADGEAQPAEAQKQTFRELTSAYSLTTDPDQSVYMDYMEAAGQNGIPTAFIVGKTGQVEWIGHPMQMDAPLAAVVDGSWDRAAFKAEFDEKQQIEILMTTITRSMQRGKPAEALAAIDEALGKIKSEQMQAQLKLIRLQVQLSDPASQDRLPEILPSAYQTYADNPELINVITWNVYQKYASGELQDASLLKATRAAAEQAAQQADAASKAAILDTVSHLQFQAGDIDAAIKSQTAAVEAADPNLKAQLSEFLEELKEAKQKSGK